MKRSLLTIILLSCLIINSSAEKISPASYTFDAKTLTDKSITDAKAFADDNKSKLTDGVLNSSRVVWRYKDNSSKPVKIEFTFASPIKLNEITLHIFRGPRSYGIKKISVFGIDANEANFPLGNEVLNHPYELPKGENPDSSIKFKLDSSNSVIKVIVEITGTGSYLGLSEIEFNGEMSVIKTETAKFQANPWDNLASSATTGLRLIKNGQAYILENDLAIYVIDPDNSGIVNYAYDKIAKFNFIKYGEGNVYGGMFNDRFWPGDYTIRDMFRQIPYKVEIVSDEVHKKAIKLSANGKSGIFSNVTIEKTYTLNDNSPVIAVNYQVKNDQVNVIPLQYGLWIMGGVTSEEPFNLIYPGAYKTEVTLAKPQTLYYPGAIQGWSGAIQNSGRGIALLADYQLLKNFSFWSNSSINSTIECRLGVYSIKANDKLETTFALVPFYGVGIPDNVNSTMAGSLGLGKDYTANSTLKLLPFRPGKYTITLERGMLIDNKVKFETFNTQELELKTSPFNLSYDLKPSAPGTWIVRVTVKQNNQVVFTLEGATIFNRSSGAYQRNETCEKRLETNAKKNELNLNFNSLEYMTPHFNWAKPFAGKIPKVLVVCYRKAGIRDMLEVAERFDMELTTNYIGGIWQISGLTTSLNEEDCYNELLKVLKKNFDAIVVSSDMWVKMPKSAQEAILSKVENGTGLVLIAPEGLPDSLSKYFTIASKAQHFVGQWSSASLHPITNGIPFAALPPTRALPYRSSGEPLAKVGDQVLISQFKYGKGEVLASSWAVDGRDRNSDLYIKKSDNAILPLMLYNEPQAMAYNYWEYQISLLAKMIYLVSHSITNVAGQRLQIKDSMFSAELTAIKPEEVTAELTIRDKFSRTEEVIRQDIELKAGTNEVTIHFKTPVLNGLHFADLIVKNNQGALWWGSQTFEKSDNSGISNFKVESKIWQREEPFACTIEARVPEAAKVHLALYDSYGNKFSEITKNATVKMDLSLPLIDCRTLAFTVEACLEKEGFIIDRITREAYLADIPDDRKFHIGFGWPILSMRGIQSFLIKPYLSRLIELGANCYIPFRADINADLLGARELNLPFISSNAPISAGGKFPYNASAKINSKFDLIRIPCLSKTGFKEELETKSKLPEPIEKYGVLFRAGPDESNMISKWDGCFSPDCQREFRLWLQREYGSLEKLNHSWETAYGKWNEVYAMTFDEVKKRQSFAPWVDHRTFNDWNLADAIGRIVKGMKQGNASLRYSLSGTQDTNACNAWDWYMQMEHLEALCSYSGEQSIMQRCFAKGKLTWQPWLGYDRSYDSHNQQILDYLMQGATGFSIYSGAFYVNPDYTIPAFGKEMKKAINHYLDGNAEVIINSDFVSYPIAFLYSPASIKVNELLGLEDLRKSSVQGYKTVLNDLALKYDYVAYEQLEKTNILSNKYKILFLPTATAMSTKEADAVREFVKNGGIVIADSFPATYDRHGYPYAKLPLAELFGIKDNSLVTERSSGELRGFDIAFDDFTLKGLKLPIKYFQNGVEATTAKVLAEVRSGAKTCPAVLVNKFGQGYAIYLNGSLASTYGEFAEMRYTSGNQNNAKIINQLLQTIMAKKQLNPIASIPDLKVTNVNLRQNGPAYILGIVREVDQALNIDRTPSSQKVQLNKKYYVYDLINHKYLTHDNQFSYVFGPTTQSVFVLLPYQVRTLEIRLDRPGFADIQLTADTRDWANHIFKVELKDSSNKSNPAYKTVLFGKGNKAEYPFRLPLNRNDGDWKLLVTDIMTGINNEVVIK